MENAYGIGVKNRYELFYDEDVDPLEIIRQQEEEKEKRKSDKSHPKDKSKTTKTGKITPATALSKKSKDNSTITPQKPSETTESSNKSRPRPFSDRNAKNSRSFEDSKDIEERKNFRNREDHGLNTENRERDSELRRGRGGFRGRGRARGRGGFFNYDNRPPRREFDRHSGSDKSGLRATDKREGAGANNWGDMKSEFSAAKKEQEPTWGDDEFDASGEKQTDSSWGEILPENNVSSPGKDEGHGEKCDDSLNENVESKENLPVSEERTEETAREMTLDEWKREQEAKRAIPKYNIRKPGEGEDGNQWKKLYVLKKKVKEDDDDEEDDDEDVDDDEFARRGRQRQLVDIQINFNDSRRGRGRGRGSRGIGPRSERGANTGKDVNREDRRDNLSGPSVGGRSYRGSMKINKSGQQSAPRVDDWNDFPSLVTA
ncbi:plasminogen activator inhibitor 1 RNA-binding protein-like [Argiope bruennichi]|uniref:Plasminogen activator inhibitor 1 RNA-binding like protein n=1 Tax=Argiope bruennichi TaxID=94029 RepID=A0A8T0F113_ARGBR|nr:plasminogen activator inhibitor 1 RNA-binding protein-like [Argiope bruennichi]KAF8784824.1 Plasminogen activator inhibitor 1 RNA-binding like protein [Argiope bruennichi]